MICECVREREDSVKSVVSEAEQERERVVSFGGLSFQKVYLSNDESTLGSWKL